LNTPSAGRTTAARSPHGSHSYTLPREISSHDSHEPHGVLQPAQLTDVSSRMRYAPTMRPSAAKRTAPTPPFSAGGIRGTSELDTSTHPPSGIA
jgi:hypothetical protein